MKAIAILIVIFPAVAWIFIEILRFIQFQKRK